MTHGVLARTSTPNSTCHKLRGSFAGTGIRPRSLGSAAGPGRVRRDVCTRGEARSGRMLGGSSAPFAPPERGLVAARPWHPGPGTRSRPRKPSREGRGPAGRGAGGDGAAREQLPQKFWQDEGALCRGKPERARRGSALRLPPYLACFPASAPVPHSTGRVPGPPFPLWVA